MRVAEKKKYLSSFVLSKDATVKDAIEQIDKGGKEIALVCEGMKLFGIVTDSDIRKAILRGVGLSDPASNAINYDFHYAWIDEDKNSVYSRMTRDYIKQLPVINKQREIVDIYFLSDIGKQKDVRSTPVLIMAGGMGKRLRPLTDQVPKPMLLVGGKPLLETIITKFREHGFTNILLSVNYRKDIIKNYFQNGENFDVSIRYIEEPQQMGTAGSISLARDLLIEPFFVINGDLLTSVHFKNFLEYHIAEKVDITVGTTVYDMRVPYGVMNIENNRVISVKEKPEFEFFINAGIYCLNPSVLKYIPKNRYFDITQLIEKLLKNQCEIASFPIHEYWMDIGQIIDYEKANREFNDMFI